MENYEELYHHEKHNNFMLKQMVKRTWDVQAWHHELQEIELCLDSLEEGNTAHGMIITRVRRLREYFDKHCLFVKEL